MKVIQTNTLNKFQKNEVNRLWNNEYPEKIKHSELGEFEKYLENLTDPSHLLLVDAKGHIKAWYFDFIREDEKWFAMILDSTVQGKGFGTKLLNLAKDKETELNAWVIDHSNDKKKNGEFYKSPIEFYRKNGFKILSGVRLEIDKLSAVKIKWIK